MRIIVRSIGILFSVVLAAGLGVGVYFYQEYRTFEDSPVTLPEHGTRYHLAPGATLRRVAHDMESSGVVTKAEYLIIMGRLDGISSRLRAGEYQIPAGIKPRMLLQLFVSGKVIQYSFTIVEGWSFKLLLDAVRNSGLLVHTLVSDSIPEIMAKIGHPDIHPEGRFLPETYQFPRGTTDVEFLIRAFETMEHQLATAWATREDKLPLKSPEEALTLASIIEKETGVPVERPEIAGVFVRRLRKGMKLQTDPTVIYGMGESYDGNIRRKDLLADTPYNTYTRTGLPPTPIALPGAAAIDAALHPKKGNTLYFVAKGDGSHYFSRTLREHNNAVARYQLRRR